MSGRFNTYSVQLVQLLGVFAAGAFLLVSVPVSAEDGGQYSFRNQRAETSGQDYRAEDGGQYSRRDLRAEDGGQYRRSRA